MILALKDPAGADWNEAVLHGLGALAVSRTDEGVAVAPDIDLSGYAAAAAAHAATALAALRTGLCADVDAAAETLRATYITSGSGQAMIYLQKQTQAAQAQAGLAAQPPMTADQGRAQLVLLAAEIGITVDPQTGVPATDVFGVARAVAATVQAWLPIGAAIEAVRLKTKAAIAAAPTAAAAQAAHDAATWPPPA